MSKFSQKLDISQSQNLVMTPQLQQAIKMLQLNNRELNELVEEEIEKNPLLEKDDSKQEEKQETPDLPNSDFDAGSRMSNIGSGGNLKFESNENSLENRISAEKSLQEYLMNQLNMSFSDEHDRIIGTLIIDRLDENGYLRDDIQILTERLGCSEQRIEKLLSKMKQFSPTGIFANDLSECLALQLDEQGKLDAPMELFLNNISMLGDYDFKGLAEKCGVNDTYLMDMVDEIKGLNPKPASEFDHIVVQTAIPDVLMKRLPSNLGGGWRVELNNDTLPKVLINQEYSAQISQGKINKKDREYVTNQLSSANWLVRAMDQRAQTILKVASEIIKQQDAFFNYGIEFLQPLTLKDISEEIDMHESTVSRVTTNKYIGTPRGIFELKFFFSSGLTSESGAIHSSEAIKARIKSLIDNEDPKKILSDDKIVSILKDERIDIARRTIAKYREAMHIGSSVQRRKQKR